MPYSSPLNEGKNNASNNQSQSDIWVKLGITSEEFNELVEFRANYEARNHFKFFMMGVLFLPVTLLGAVIGFVRAHNRFFRPRDVSARLYPIQPIKRVSMAIGIIAAWVVTAALVVVLYFAYQNGAASYRWSKLIGFYTTSAILSAIILSGFALWRTGLNNLMVERKKFGSARFARPDELYTRSNKTGYYIGQGNLFNDRGHLLTVAGTRGGKGTNIIIPNLLDAGSMETSWVIIDPKGENAAVTADYQRMKGQNVVILNPWDLLVEHVGMAHPYNPLDLLGRPTDPNLVDDVAMLAEMIVPIKPDDHNKFFTDASRILISGLLLHLVTTKTGNEKTLKTLWEWTRKTGDDWQELLAEMGLNDTPVNGDVVQKARLDILKLMMAGEETFGSIIADVLVSTDFLKSPPLQESMQSGFDPAVLADGKTTVYVIIPADKLKSHSRWLRLVVTSLMRSVIRKPNKRVTFLLDEFAALGYISEIETALSTYAGYNVTVWPILQTLGQLEGLYGQSWQTFIANCTVRQYFSINDNFSAEYISQAIGATSHLSVIKAWFGIKDATSNPRPLITPDELRRESGKRIFMFIGDLPATYIDKLPYYLVPELNERAMKNPYI